MKQKVLWASIISALEIILIMFSYSPVSAQPILCIETPSSSNGFVECNKTIAITFAPRIIQWASYCDSGSGDALEGDSDRWVKANFDGDWVATNNWENASNYANYGGGAYPYSYYAVLWTENFWIITYSHYYSRDYAGSELFCDSDEHEGDLTRVVILVKRPESTEEKPEDLVMGLYTGNPTGFLDDSGWEVLKCIDKEDPFQIKIEDEDSETGLAYGAHLRAAFAAGSHHSYQHPGSAFGDGVNPCNPWPVMAILYDPSHTPAMAAFCSAANPPQLCPFPCGYSEDWLATYANTYHHEYYGLIDVFDPEEGLWEQRNNPQLFNDESLSFLCDNGGGCPESGASASAPWKGSGVDPIPLILNHFSYLPCEDIWFEDDVFLYNPYLDVCNIENPPPPSFEIDCCPNALFLDAVNPGTLTQKHKYSALNLIEATNVVAQGGEAVYNVTLESGNIKLLPGFIAENGSEFQAFIGGDCSPQFFINANHKIKTSSELDLSILNKEAEVANRLNIYPNPSKGAINIMVDLAKLDKVSLDLIDSDGELLLNLLEGEKLEPGHHSFVLENQEISAGTYFVRLSVHGQKPMTKKLIMLE